ncbi:SH3 domain-containing protein PJ696.02-like protein 2 [Colletotrichum chlorophyti]|uniref:SH3 domain-containing protein PJ696.02-like protein 2 n=1 Tax=Colletotrichum chlorophyti TaxID=708187 RepID=A0A1Q8RSH8_9PEZI|nr:SH3 domain-containing protein PJ696.02-like protein 2 [Colletotrichum chlorophyti]
MSGTNPEKPPIPQEQPLYPQQATGATQNSPQYGSGEKSELPGQGQHFPPPPPGPPPANQPQFTHAPQPQQGYAASSQQQQYQQYQQPQQQQYHHQQQYNQPPHGQYPPAQHSNATPLADYNPTQYGAGHQQFAPPPGAGYTDPATAQSAAAAAAATDPNHPQKQHRGWGERLSQIGMKAAVPINALANKMGSQSFLPTTMDKECEKAAKILRSFCKEGIASDVLPQTQPSEKLEPPKPADGHGSQPTTPSKDKARKEQKAIVKIPSKVINKAVGLAIVTTARIGFQFSGATGSGVLIARLPDGSWSPPSGIQVHALGAGFMIGVDLYDCVLVINSREALSSFMSTRVSLGPDVAVVAGPYGAGGTLDLGASFGGKKPEEQKAAVQAANPDGKPADDGKLKPQEKNKRRSSSSSLKPVFSYVKSRGFYAGVQVDGTVITERKDANAAFYGQKISVDQIIRGQVPAQGPGGMWPAGAQALYEALRTAEAQQPLPDANLPPPAPVPAAGQVPQYGAAPQQPQYGGGRPEGTAIPAYGQPQYTHSEGGPLGSHPPSGSGPYASGALGREEQLPGYVDDGVARPGVGDQKGTYQ